MQRSKKNESARAAQNQLLFRAVNEQIVEMTENFRSDLSDLNLVCECWDTFVHRHDSRADSRSYELPRSDREHVHRPPGP